MPRGDGTGPQGQGSMTGRRMGNCNSGNRSINPVQQDQGTRLGNGFLSGVRNFFGTGRQQNFPMSSGRGRGNGRGQNR